MSIRLHTTRTAAVLLVGASALLPACSASPDDTGLDTVPATHEDAAAPDDAADAHEDGEPGSPDGAADAQTDAPGDAGTFDAPHETSAGDAPQDGPAGTADYPAETEPNDTEPTANALPSSAKGFTGALDVNDVDWFSFKVTVPGSSVRIATSDGNGGCPANAGTILKLYSPTNVELGYDSDSGINHKCSLIDPKVVPWAAKLPVGTYTVAVSNFPPSQVVSSYVVSIEVIPPQCSDGTIQGAEECDDGNKNDGDGCSSTCAWENSWQNAKEPNDTSSTANALAPGKAGFAATITSNDDEDWFSFDVNVPGSSVTVTITDGLGKSCPPSFYGYLDLYDASHSYLAGDSGYTSTVCPRIDPVNYPEASNLAAGTYLLDVTTYGWSGQYFVKIEVSPPKCPNGIAESKGGEQCDDGNALSGDGCSPTCTIEPLGPADACDGVAVALSGTGSDPRIGIVSGTTAAVADNYGGSCQSYGATKTKDAVYQVTSDVDGMLSASIVTGFDAAIYARTSCSDSSTEVACDSRVSGQGGFVTMPVKAGVPAFLFVDGYDTSDQGGYSMTVTVLPSVCGNYVLDPGEQCDDGVPSTGAGCSDACRFDPALADEVEPNDTRSTATPLGAGTAGWWGSIASAGDVDWYSFDVTSAAGSVRAETFADGTLVSPSCPNADTVIHLVDSNGTELGSDDQGGIGSCSLIDPALDTWAANLAPGTYYIWVEYYLSLSTVPHYGLAIQVQ